MCLYEFGETLTNTQAKILKSILYNENKHRRYLINGFTRFGKSFSIGKLVALYILLNEGKKVKIVAPQRSQCKPIMKSFTESMMKSKTLIKLLPIEGTRKSKIGKSVTQNSYTFNNGCTVEILGVHGEGTGAMGEGADLLICDELGLIEPKTYQEKVHRLLGDNAESSIFVGLFNPWSEDTIAYDFWENPRYTCFHIDWRIGIEEGRISQEYLEEQRELLDEYQFEVLFESRFPKQINDTILSLREMKASYKRIIAKSKYLDIEVGVDVARFGPDSTTIYVRHGLKVLYRKKIQGKDTVEVAALVWEAIKYYHEQGYSIRINVDDTGVGGGVTDNLRLHLEPEGILIVAINNGSKAANEDMYFNKTSELWFWISDNIEDIQICSGAQSVELIKDFTKRKYKYVGKGKKRLESKDEMKARGIKSPDDGDGLSYCFASECDYIIRESNIGVSIRGY